MAARRPLRCLFSAASSPSNTPLVRPSTRTLSTTAPSRAPEYDAEAADRPRWQQTPPRMMAPVRIRPRARGGVYKVNEDPRRLDAVYVRLLGPGGDKVLGDEAKWLAVTHKSFDHGRRGFNDRLAYLGRRIVELQTSQALINSPQEAMPTVDQYGRRPFQHAALAGLQGLSDEAERMVLANARLSQIAERYGLDGVTRWTPKRADNLEASGKASVLTTSLYAIVGAVALEQGGEAANKVVQEKILTPLGFNFAPEL